MVVSDTAIYILIAVALSVFLYAKISRMFASLMVFILGVGMMYVDKTYSFTGLIVMASGLIMFIYAIMTPPSRIRRGR